MSLRRELRLQTGVSHCRRGLGRLGRGLSVGEGELSDELGNRGVQVLSRGAVGVADGTAHGGGEGADVLLLLGGGGIHGLVCEDGFGVAEEGLEGVFVLLAQLFLCCFLIKRFFGRGWGCFFGGLLCFFGSFDRGPGLLETLAVKAGCLAVDGVFGGAGGEEDALGVDLEHVAWVEEVTWVDHLRGGMLDAGTFAETKDILSYLLAINLHTPMNNKLSCLPRTARKQRPEDRRIQSPLHRCKSHIHKRDRGRAPLISISNVANSTPALVSAGAAAGSLLGAVEGGQVAEVHGDDGLDARGEHALPLLLADLLAVVGARGGLGLPLLLEVGAADLGAAELGEVVEVVLVHGHADFLEGTGWLATGHSIRNSAWEGSMRTGRLSPWKRFVLILGMNGCCGVGN